MQIEMLSGLNWGGPGYSAYDGVMAAGASATGAAAGAGTGTGAGAGAPATGGSGVGQSSGSGASGAGVGTPGSPSGATGDGSGTSPSSGQGASGPSPTPGSQGSGNDQNIAALRQSHETLTRLGGPQQVQAAVERYTKMHTTASDLATRLGYTPESFEEAFAEAPAEIYNHLMTEAQQAQVARGQGQGQGQGREDVNAALERRLAPINQVLQRQMAREANTLADGEFNQRFDSHTLFKDKNVPAKVREAVYNHFTDLVKHDEKTMRAVLNGDASGLGAYFDKAVANMVEFANNWGGWQTGAGTSRGTGAGAGAGTAGAGAGTGQGEGGNGGRNPFSLDDVIEGGDNATRAMPSLRNFRSA